jgi:Domain of unknown function (DUF4328)/Protein of unknown function (DUF2510)
MTVRGEGWYADPQDPAMLRWWDGATWTVHTHDPAASSSAHHGPLPRWWGGLTVGLQLGLLLNVATSLYVLYVDQQILAFVEELRLRPDTVVEADGARIDTLVARSSVALLPWLGTGLLFVIWTYTLHHSARMDRSVLRHGSGWAIGGWFVPVLSFWRPFQMVLDVRRGATGDADLPTTRTLGWWWATFWASYAAGLVAAFYYRALASTSDDDPGSILDHFTSAASWERGSELVAIVSALLAIRVVREVRSLVRAERA